MRRGVTITEEVKVKKVTKYTQPSECAFCGGDLDDDPYRVEIVGRDDITLCDTCGENFCGVFGIKYQDET